MLYVGLLFVAGNLVVAAFAYLHRRLMRRDPDLVSRRADVLELTDRQERIEAGEAELAVSELEQRELARQMEAAQTRAANRVPLRDSPSAKYGWRLVGLFLAEGEALILALQGALNEIAGLEAPIWAFISPIFIAILVAVLHFVFGHMVADHSRPARTARRAKRLFVIASVAVMAGGWLLMSGRNIADPQTVENLAGIGFMILLGLLALSSAFALIVATTLFEAENDTQYLTHLVRLQSLYAQHIDLIKKDLARLNAVEQGSGHSPSSSSPMGATTSTQPSTPSVAPVGIVPTVVLAFMLIAPALAVGQTSAEPLNTPLSTSNVNSGASSAPGLRLRVTRNALCTLLVDLSSSVDATPLKATLEQLREQVPLIVETLKCGIVHTAPFVGDLFLTVTETAIPQLSDIAKTCESAQPAYEKSTSRVTDFLYPKVAQARREEAVRHCLAENQKLVEEQKANRNVALARVASELSAMVSIKPGGPCTALNEVVRRVASTSESVVVITDGVQTCPSAKSGELIPNDVHLLFLLVPTGNANTQERAKSVLSRVQELERTFPGALAVLASEAAVPSFWRRLVLD